MQRPVSNILDQLLGAPELAPGAKPSVPNSAAPGGPLFKEVLSDLGANLKQKARGQASGVLPFDLPVGDDVAANGENADITQLGKEQVLPDSAATPGALETLLEAFTAISQQQQAQAPDVQAAFTNQKQSDASVLPQSQQQSHVVDNFAAKVAANPQWQQVQNWQPANLEPAVYKVLDTKLADNRLEMTIVGNDDTAEPVKVSVPANILTAVEKRSHAQRVSLEPAQRKADARTNAWTTVGSTPDYSETTRRHVVELLQQLRLKALDLTNQQPATKAQHPGNDVAVRLTAEYKGRQVTLEQKLPRRELRVRTPQANQTLQTKQTANGTVEPHLLRSARTGENALDGTHASKREFRTSARSVAVPSKIQLVRQVFDLTDKLASDKSDTVDLSLFSNKLAGADGTKAVARQGGEPLPVRFSLPEQLLANGRPLDQTLMLKIEPEHLGPARLHLSMHHDSLTARVYVDTPLAKTMVEGSLDHLRQQLQRAGIQVDRIEVTVSGGGARNEFLDRRPAWARQMKSRPGYFDEDETIEPVAVAGPIAGHLAAQYVRDTGVNLLA